ncbi:hypothetical protein [Methylobacterium sp. JK268]
MSTLPRLASVTALTGSAVRVTWTDGRTDEVELVGWIATGGEILRPLRDPETFATVRLGEYGASLAWGEEDGDLAIDAYHLHQIAAEQRPFRSEDLAAWQETAEVSNQEAADFLGVSLSTWNAYKATGNVPPQIRMLCRAALRDPVLFQAHLRPRKAGRPRRAQA